MPKHQATTAPRGATAATIEQIPVSAIRLDPAYTLRQPDPLWTRKLARTIMDPASCPLELGVPTDDPAFPPLTYMVIDGTQRYSAYTTQSMMVNARDVAEGFHVGAHHTLGTLGPRFTMQDTLPCTVRHAPWAELLFAAALANERSAPAKALDEKSHRRAAEWIFQSRPLMAQREVAAALHCSQSTIRNYLAAYKVRQLAPAAATGLTNEVCEAVYRALGSDASPAHAPNLIAPLLEHFRAAGAKSQALTAKLKAMVNPDAPEQERAAMLAQIENRSLFTVPDTRGTRTEAPSAETPADEDAVVVVAANAEAPAVDQRETLRQEFWSWFRYSARMVGKADPSFVALAILHNDLATMEMLPVVERVRSFCQHIEAAVQVETHRREVNARQPETVETADSDPTDDDLHAQACAALDADGAALDAAINELAAA